MPPVRHILVPLGMLASSLAIVTAPGQEALGGQSSTPVTVVNPSTDPALTSNIDNPGRVAYQSVVIGQQSGATCAGSSSCTFSFMAVPHGRRLVVQHVSGALTFNGTPDTIEVLLSSLGIESKNTAPPAFSAFFAGSVDNASWFDQQVLVYFKGGSTPLVTVTSLAASGASGSGAGKQAPAFTGATQPVTLTGYLVNCNLIPCAAIAPIVTR
jgi:hypothetical protein